MSSRKVAILVLAVLSMQGCRTSKQAETVYERDTAITAASRSVAAKVREVEEFITEEIEVGDVYFSVPDSSGRQHVERVRHISSRQNAAEKSVVKEVENKCDTLTLKATEKRHSLEYSESKPNGIPSLAWIVVAVLIVLIFMTLKRIEK